MGRMNSGKLQNLDFGQYSFSDVDTQVTLVKTFAAVNIKGLCGTQAEDERCKQCFPAWAVICSVEGRRSHPTFGIQTQNTESQGGTGKLLECGFSLPCIQEISDSRLFHGTWGWSAIVIHETLQYIIRNSVTQTNKQGAALAFVLGTLWKPIVLGTRHLPLPFQASHARTQRAEELRSQPSKFRYEEWLPN